MCQCGFRFWTHQVFSCFKRFNTWALSAHDVLNVYRGKVKQKLLDNQFLRWCHQQSFPEIHQQLRNTLRLYAVLTQLLMQREIDWKNNKALLSQKNPLYVKLAVPERKVQPPQVWPCCSHEVPQRQPPAGHPGCLVGAVLAEWEPQPFFCNAQEA